MNSPEKFEDLVDIKPVPVLARRRLRRSLRLDRGAQLELPNDLPVFRNNLIALNQLKRIGQGLEFEIYDYMLALARKGVTGWAVHDGKVVCCVRFRNTWRIVYDTVRFVRRVPDTKIFKVPVEFVCPRECSGAGWGGPSD